MLLGVPGLKFHGHLSVDSQVHAVAEVGLWRGVKGLTPIAFVLEKGSFVWMLQLSIISNSFFVRRAEF